MSYWVRYSKHIAAVAGLALSLGASSALAGASSDFNTGTTDGWLLFGDSVTSAPTYVATGGVTGGYIHGTDAVLGGTWYWLAPAKFLDNDSASYGDALSFDLRMRGNGSLFSDADVILQSGGTSLFYTFGTGTNLVPADTTWTPYSVLLSETAGWRVGSQNGVLANQTQVMQVLANVTSLQIRGEFISGPDNGDLDHVLLAPIPEPETWALMLAGLGLIGAAARRRRAR